MTDARLYRVEQYMFKAKLMPNLTPKQIERFGPKWIGVALMTAGNGKEGASPTDMASLLSIHLATSWRTASLMPSAWACPRSTLRVPPL